MGSWSEYGGDGVVGPDSGVVILLVAHARLHKRESQRPVKPARLIVRRNALMVASADVQIEQVEAHSAPSNSAML